MGYVNFIKKSIDCIVLIKIEVIIIILIIIAIIIEG